MSEPTTARGKRLLQKAAEARDEGMMRPWSWGDMFVDIPLIEDEARAQLRAEIAKGVEGLPPLTCEDGEPLVDRAAVLALIRNEPE